MSANLYLEGELLEQSDDEFWDKHQVGHNFFETESSTTLNKFSLTHFERSNLNNNSVGYPKPKETSRRTALPVFEVKIDRKLFQTKSNLLMITPKKQLKDCETANYHGVVKKIILGLEYNLKPFKSLLEKQKLLQAAIHSHDGNAILVVVLFMKDTLKKSIFQKEIMMYLDAVNMYLSYLHEDREIHELENMLLLLRRQRDVVIKKYEDANLILDQKRKLDVLINLQNTYCQFGAVERFISDSILEHCMCIEDHRILMDHKIVSEQCDDDILQSVINRREITDSCAVHALIFSLLHFYNVAEIANISPSTIKNRYKISSRKYQWCALITLAAAKSFVNIEKLFLAKKWLGGTKIQSSVPYQTILEILSRYEAPLEIMERFCEALDQSDKLHLAQKYHCNNIVIEILKKKRSKSALLKFQKTLSPESIAYHKIKVILDSVDIKWKP